MRLNKYHKQAIVRAIMNDIPAIDTIKRAEAIKEAIFKAMSPEVRKLYNLRPKALRTASVKYTSAHSTWGADVVVGDLTKAQIEVILKPYEEEESKRDAVYRQLSNTVEGCATLKQLGDVLPEFKAYFPTEDQPVKNLPAVANLVTDMTKLGWPKGKK